MSSNIGNHPLRLRLPLRFIHASDLHLDRTVEQVPEGPVHWEQRLWDVSRRAAERLFQKVVEESVDFLILSGDVLNANLAPPGTLLFLVDQFERLKKAGIAVYWAGGEFDSPEDWPSAFPLPDNVHHLPGNTIQEFYFQRLEGGTSVPVARIVGMSRNHQRRRIRSTEFPLDPGGLYTIAVSNGDVDPESLSQRRIDFWALGGSSQRQTFHGNPRKKGLDGKPIPLDPPEEPGSPKRDRKDLPPPPYTVHYPGTTVARSPKQVGLYGATLVEIPWGEEPVLTFFPTSPIRWVNDQITLEASDDGGKLADELRIRIKNYREAQLGSPSRADDLMISWYVDVPPGTLASALRRGSLTNDLLNELRTLYGKEEPLTWSVSINQLLPEQFPKAFYEQQTILGDFLRSVKHFQENPREMIDLGVYLPKDGEEKEQESGRRFAGLLLADKVEVDPAEKTDVEKPAAEKGSLKTFRYAQTTEQAETQRRILREAAMVGLELLGGEGSKLYHEIRPATLQDSEETE